MFSREKLSVPASVFSVLRENEDGVTAIEYGLIGVAMAVLLSTVIFVNGGELITAINNVYQAIADALEGAI